MYNTGTGDKINNRKNRNTIFRFIYRITIANINDINVFSGKNDAGKSNVLKAFNLFFNNLIYDGDYIFKENYNLQRLEEVRRETIKDK